MLLIRTKFGRKKRRKKPEEDLKTLYYYRQGPLVIENVDNSGLGLYDKMYVFIKKYSKERDQFLIEDVDGVQTWTDFIVPIRPTVNGYDVYHTCFEFLAENNIQPGEEICYRVKNGFAFLKKIHHVSHDKYVLYRDGFLNFDAIPKGFNFCLGYCENEVIQKNKALLLTSCQISTNSYQREEA